MAFYNAPPAPGLEPGLEQALASAGAGASASGPHMQLPPPLSSGGGEDGRSGSLYAHGQTHEMDPGMGMGLDAGMGMNMNMGFDMSYPSAGPVGYAPAPGPGLGHAPMGTYSPTGFPGANPFAAGDMGPDINAQYSASASSSRISSSTTPAAALGFGAPAPASGMPAPHHHHQQHHAFHPQQQQQPHGTQLQPLAGAPHPQAQNQGQGQAFAHAPSAYLHAPGGAPAFGPGAGAGSKQGPAALAQPPLAALAQPLEAETAQAIRLHLRDKFRTRVRPVGSSRRVSSSGGGDGNGAAGASTSGAGTGTGADAAGDDDKPCDRCRSKRKLCSRGQPCGRCAKAGAPCTYLHQPHRTGPLSRAEQDALRAAGLGVEKQKRKPYVKKTPNALPGAGSAAGRSRQPTAPTQLPSAADSSAVGAGPSFAGYGSNASRAYPQSSPLAGAALSECDFSDASSVTSSVASSSYSFASGYVPHAPASEPGGPSVHAHARSHSHSLRGPHASYAHLQARRASRPPAFNAQASGLAGPSLAPQSGAPASQSPEAAAAAAPPTPIVPPRPPVATELPLYGPLDEAALRAAKLHESFFDMGLVDRLPDDAQGEGKGKDIAAWVSQHARITVAPQEEGASPVSADAAEGAENGPNTLMTVASAIASPEAAAGAIRITLPDYLTGDVHASHEQLERETLVTDYPLAQDIPALFRRLPNRPSALQALQAGKRIYLYDECPDCPAWHPPAQLLGRPLPLGESIARANPAAPYVLILDAEGLVQAVPPLDCHLDGRAIFQAAWSCPARGGRAIGPPWDAIRAAASSSAAEGAHAVSIWPHDYAPTDAEYADLTRQAHRILTREATAQMIEYETALRPGIRLIFQERISDWLLQLEGADPLTGIPPSWTPLQARQRMAILLSLQLSYAQVAGQFEASIGGQEAKPPAESPLVLRASISAWEYSFNAMKLVWRLLQPRRGGLLNAEELTLEALIAMHTLVKAMRLNPSFREVQLCCLRLIAAPSTHQAILRDVHGDPERIVGYQRLLTLQLLDATSLRFWLQKDLQIRFGQHFRDVGADVHLFPGEKFQDQGGPTPVVTRQQWRWMRAVAKLALVNEDLLDSPLMAVDPTNADPASILAAAKHFYEQMGQWHAETFDHAAAIRGAHYDKEKVEREQGRWAFLFVPTMGERSHDDQLYDHYVVTLELVIATLLTVQNHASPSPASDSPHNSGRSPQSDVYAGLADMLHRYQDLRAAVPPVKLKFPHTRDTAWMLYRGACQAMTRIHGNASRWQDLNATPPP